MPPTSALLVIGAVAMGTTFVLTPVVIVIARRMGWVVEPDARRVHTKTMPDVGGLAMVIAVVVAMGVARMWDVFDPMFARNSEPTGVVVAAVAMYAVGFIDDLRELSAPAKVAGTIAVGMILVTMGVTMYYFRLPWLGVFVPGDDWMPLVTLIWLLLMTQAINLIDGLDGLAAGIVAIAAGAFFLYSLRLSELKLITPPNVGPLVAIITVGVCVGFLPWNFNPARIFMGDGGALLLGLLLAVSTSVV
ncbi:MAG TPA: MraY family glycosyltransferase, partial [Ilumatobacteraceae bacterium]|nr:MraY family glycosyltransferase [Ilumatobacteraceae bacterium]